LLFKAGNSSLNLLSKDVLGFSAFGNCSYINLSIVNSS